MNVLDINKEINRFFDNNSLSEYDILDMAFLGSFSGHYGWKKTLFGDCDLWFFYNSICDSKIFNKLRVLLEKLSDYLKNIFPAIIITYEIANGPYKPAKEKLYEEYLFLHIIVDDKNSYCNHSDFTKLSWSKYTCINDTNLLEKLCNQNLLSLDLVTAKYGLKDAMNCIIKKETSIIKYDFNSFSFKEYIYHLDDLEFTEFMFYIAMTNARNYFRAYSISTADSLANEKFVEEFCSITKIILLKDIYEQKKLVEENGYAISNTILLYNNTKSFIEQLYELWNDLHINT